MTDKSKEHIENIENEDADIGTSETTKTTKTTENEDVEKNEKQVQVNEEEEDALQNEIENLNDKLLRLQADFLNYKARTEKEKTSTYSNAVSGLILELLPVVDNFERALEADATEGSSYKEGVQMVYDQLMGIFEKNGLKEVEAIHKPFDHNFHYGVGVEASDEFENETVIDVLQKGYTVNDRCIRPAMVRVVKND